MDRVSKQPWRGETVIFATQHEKEKILLPFFQEIGVSLTVAKIDSDALGTFSGELERKGSVRETLRSKIKMAFDIFPNNRLFLSSEGSFGPHPIIGLIPSDLESLLFFDAHADIEIYADYLSTEVVAGERIFYPNDDVSSFLKELHVPSHGVIVRPSDRYVPIFKGLHDENQVSQAMDICARFSGSGTVVVSSDLRAHHSPTRQKAICEAGKKLIEILRTFCPLCRNPGFSITNGLPGLPCEDCGEATQVTKEVVRRCPNCAFEEVSLRPDGLMFVDAGNCQKCNP